MLLLQHRAVFAGLVGRHRSPGIRACLFSSLRFGRNPLNALIYTHIPTAIGKYLISPLSRRLDDGRYRASVSIRSGHGSASTDRVMRFANSFESAGAAHRYAHQQGLEWVSQSDSGFDSAVSTALS